MEVSQLDSLRVGLHGPETESAENGSLTVGMENNQGHVRVDIECTGKFVLIFCII